MSLAHTRPLRGGHPDGGYGDHGAWSAGHATELTVLEEAEARREAAEWHQQRRLEGPPPARPLTLQDV